MDFPGESCAAHRREAYSFRLFAAACAAQLAKPVSVSLLEDGAKNSGRNRCAIRQHANGVVRKAPGFAFGKIALDHCVETTL